jgi:UDP-N-acetylglucosamine 2-epimerase (non-hydrolysing)
LVFGDVNSTLACSIVAKKMGIEVAHVEAGLRSGDRTMPEEVNRIVTDALADLLFTPSMDANENLRREGLPKKKIRLVGNIMIDSLLAHLDEAQKSNILNRLGLKEHRFIYVTLHRPSNVDCKPTLEAVVNELSAFADKWPIIFPIHPRTKKRLVEFGLPLGNKSGLRLLDPLGYHDSLALTKYSYKSSKIASTIVTEVMM